MYKMLSTSLLSAILFAILTSFSVFHSPPASALISIICMGDPETGVITCTASDDGDGGDGGDPCAYYGTNCGGPSFGTPPGSGGGGGSTSVSQERAKGVVERFKLPCKGANESSEVYSGRAVEACVSESNRIALQEYGACKYLPGCKPALFATITSLCTTHVADQIASGKYSTC